MAVPRILNVTTKSLAYFRSSSFLEGHKPTRISCNLALFCVACSTSPKMRPNSLVLADQVSFYHVVPIAGQPSGYESGLPIFNKWLSHRIRLTLLQRHKDSHRTRQRSKETNKIVSVIEYYFYKEKSVLLRIAKSGRKWNNFGCEQKFFCLIVLTYLHRKHHN